MEGTTTRVLITGIAGSLARLTAERMIALGYAVEGVDYRERPADFPAHIGYHQANYNKTKIDDIMRRFRPDGVMHLGRVGNLKMQVGKRFDLNVVGSAKVMETALKYGVKRLIVLSTFHIYGAHAHNHIPIYEDEPLRAGTTFPQIADAVQLDNLAVQWTYRHRLLRTAVLRPCNVIGPHIGNAISRYLRQPKISYVAGFSPMWQFVHERDMVQALVKMYASSEVGVFNVAGAGALPLLRAIELTGARSRAIPSPLATAYLRLRSGLRSSFPPYLLDFFRYPCVIGDDKIRAAVNYEPEVGITDSIRSCVQR